MGRYIFVIVSNPIAGKEEEYNDWYSTQHLQDVLNVPGFVAAQRFKATHDSTLPGQYLAIYEMVTDDPQATLAELERRSGTPALLISDALDIANVSATLCVPVTERITIR